MPTFLLWYNNVSYQGALICKELEHALSLPELLQRISKEGQRYAHIHLVIEKT